ncbi:MAG: EF-hand domain-containing protein [Rhodobacter sp.]|nr:EF-hand domain-containing protein [Paracoccaceae bacterium]MCC0077177.1 EF-hand domain-containing protein [Rhodobacter sp.]
MKKLVLTLGVVSALAAAQANAQTVVTDADGNGVFSYEEMVAAFPDLTQEVFTAADTNGDGALDADELKAAQEAGTIPA